MGSVNSTFSANVHEESYRPPMGLAAAMTEHLAWREVIIPAFETEIDYAQPILVKGKAG